MKMKTKEWICVWLAIGYFVLSIALLFISCACALSDDLVRAQYLITLSLLLLVLSAAAKVTRRMFNPFLDDEHNRKAASDLKWSIAWFLASLSFSIFIAVR